MHKCRKNKLHLPQSSPIRHFSSELKISKCISPSEWVLVKDLSELHVKIGQSSPPVINIYVLTSGLWERYKAINAGFISKVKKVGRRSEGQGKC